MTEFYFNLSKNVAFGAREGESKKPNKLREESKVHSTEEESQAKAGSSTLKEGNEGETSTRAHERPNTAETEPHVESRKQKDNNDPPKQEVGSESVAKQPETDHHKRNQDALAAAKERFLARKKTKVNMG